MTEDEIKSVAETVLGPALSDAGYDFIEVKAGLDHDDTRAHFITAVLRPNSPVVGGETFSNALSALNDALLARGENRFPYLRLRHPDDIRASDTARKAS